jgi:hypothetical protein
MSHEPAMTYFSAGLVPTKDQKTFDADTEGLTNLCQKQVNHWHSKNPLSEDQVSSIKKIAKLAILTRSKANTAFVDALERGSTIPSVG